MSASLHNVITLRQKFSFRGPTRSACFAKSANVETKQLAMIVLVSVEDMGSLAELKFSKCSGRKPISLVTVKGGVDGNHSLPKDFIRLRRSAIPWVRMPLKKAQKPPKTAAKVLGHT